MSSLSVAQYYLIDGRVEGYYICDAPGGGENKAILGLKSPSEILDWLNRDENRCVYVTPHDLMAIRYSANVTRRERSVPNDATFMSMCTLLMSRNQTYYDGQQKASEKMRKEMLEDMKQRRTNNTNTSTPTPSASSAQAPSEFQGIGSEAQLTGRAGNELKHLQSRIDDFITRV
jgi:hypothetical protein